MERKVGQDLHSQITGAKNETVQGDYHFEVPGQFSQKALHGKSVYFIWQSNSEVLYLGGMNQILAGEDIAAYLALMVRLFLSNFETVIGIRTNVGARRDSLAAMYFDNEVVQLRTQLAKIKNAAAESQEVLAMMDVDAMEMDDKNCAMANFACKISTGEGLKINL